MIKNPLVQEFLNEVVQDEDNLPVVESLYNGINTDEDIAEKTEIKLNIVRKILYKLYDEGLASYKRSKDPETQWYTYAWEFDKDGVTNQITERSKARIRSLEMMLESEENNMFFACPDGHSRVAFDKASEMGFVCPECGNEISFQENHEEIARIKEEIEDFSKAYSFISAEEERLK